MTDLDEIALRVLPTIMKSGWHQAVAREFTGERSRETYYARAAYAQAAAMLAEADRLNG